MSKYSRWQWLVMIALLVVALTAVAGLVLLRDGGLPKSVFTRPDVDRVCVPVVAQ